LVASCFLGALPPVDLRAVCLVRAMAPLLPSSNLASAACGFGELDEKSRLVGRWLEGGEYL
jgi:hypothetical protein